MRAARRRQHLPTARPRTSGRYLPGQAGAASASVACALWSPRSHLGQPARSPPAEAYQQHVTCVCAPARCQRLDAVRVGAYTTHQHQLPEPSAWSSVHPGSRSIRPIQPSRRRAPNHAGGGATAAEPRRALEASPGSVGTVDGHRRASTVLLSTLTGLLFALHSQYLSFEKFQERSAVLPLAV